VDPDAVGMVSGVGLGMGVLDFGGDRRRGRGSFGMNLGFCEGDSHSDGGCATSKF